MKNYVKAHRCFHRTHVHVIRGIILALICFMALFGCDGSSDNSSDKENVYEGENVSDGGNVFESETVNQNEPPTVGSLNVNVSPASATVIVTGPENFTQTFTGNQFIADLKPGQYKAEATSPEFIDQTSEINIVVGQTSSISLFLQAMTLITDAPREVYRGSQGNLMPLDPGDLDSGHFIFYAWLENEEAGIVPGNITASTVTDPGKPTIAEQLEYAPSFTQNVASAWVGFKDAAGVVRPVIGADVRWEIDQWWTGRVNSMQFGTSDDNRIALEYGVSDDQADTRTNNGRLEAERYPFAVSEYPLYNMTGVGAPFSDGYTWVTLFSPDAVASGRIVAVATINGEEIGKQILYKNFAPKPELTITKTVDKEIVNLVNGTASVNWTVTVENIGGGDATNVNLKDILKSGTGANYTLSALPSGSVAVGDGFTYSFPLVSKLSIPAGKSTETMNFTATVTEAGTYCNEAQVLEYSFETKKWTPIGLNAEACFTALESNVSIVKDFVAEDNTTSLGKSLTVAANEIARLRVRVVNNGTGIATGVKVNDKLTDGDQTKYQLISVSTGTLNSSDGFDTNIGNLAAGASSTLLFSVKASADGKYCDTATVTATSGSIGIGSDSACLTVSTPSLTITKINAPKSVLPGATYVSTIVVHNTGSAAANDVVISDELGLNTAANVDAIYVSSSLKGVGGTLNNDVVTANGVTLHANESITFTVVSRIPLGAASGTYCNTAIVTSSNTPSKEASDCVTVPTFSALQTELIDLDDPISAGNDVTFFSVLYVEKLSNEGVKNNKLTYSFGLSSPTTLGIPGKFEMVTTKVYLDTKPVRDPVTGIVLSDTSSATARLLMSGTDYTTDNNTKGLQIITMAPNVVLQPDTALYVVHVIHIPSGTGSNNNMYTTSFIWDSVGTINPANTYEASSSEPTTVLP